MTNFMYSYYGNSGTSACTVLHPKWKKTQIYWFRQGFAYVLSCAMFYQLLIHLLLQGACLDSSVQRGLQPPPSAIWTRHGCVDCWALPKRGGLLLQTDPPQRLRVLFPSYTNRVLYLIGQVPPPALDHGRHQPRHCAGPGGSLPSGPLEQHVEHQGSQVVPGGDSKWIFLDLRNQLGNHL